MGDENGNLSFTAVNAVYTGVNALKFESKETNSIRLCRKIGDIFEPPEDGWSDRLYIIHSPMTQNISNNVSSVGQSTFGQSALSLGQSTLGQNTMSLGQSSLAPSAFAGHPLFPGYMSAPSPMAANLSANL